MPLLHTLWSPVERMPARHEPGVVEDDDLALGWESAVPALQLEAWEPATPGTWETATRTAG